MQDLLTGAVLLLATIWIGGRVWGWKRRRQAKREEVSPTWLNEHQSRQWK